MRNSAIVTIPTVTRARRQVVGPSPKPHCRRQRGNTARAAALGLRSPPPCVKDDTREVEGALSRLERVLALARGPERRTDRRSARRHLCREDVGYERVYSPTPARSTFLPQPRKCVEGTRSHTCAPDEGTPPRRGAGPAEWICTGKQPPRARARRPTFGPPGLQLGSPIASSDAGGATWSPPLALSPLGKRSVRR